jgi:hypothetical protein
VKRPRDAHRVSQEDAADPKRRVPLGPTERRAPVLHLSATNQWAIIECFNNGGLRKYNGSWHGSLEGKPISGNTVANLSRDGLLAVTKHKQAGSARLTERGERFARTLISSRAVADEVIE